jgi:L-ascorbate metabolism protein UlaG (beta-lactamase superfamily)
MPIAVRRQKVQILAMKLYHGLSAWVAIASFVGLINSSSVGAAERLTGGDAIPTATGDLVLRPINHATLALGWKDLTIYVDPVGGAGRFAGMPKPGLILITDIHGDHLNADTLRAVAGETTRLVAPPTVAQQLPEPFRARTTILGIGETTNVVGVGIEAIAAYNLAPERAKFHSKGRGVGYVLTLGGKRIYLSGDTEDIPEMRALKNIDVAFVCMNLPYTMTPEQAADAVRAFRPKIVYSYHCRGSDLEKFKKLVGEDAGVEVRIRDWYR